MADPVLMVDPASTFAVPRVDQTRVLVVENRETQTDTPSAIEVALQSEGYEVELAVGAAEGLRQFSSAPPSLVLLNTDVPGQTWIEMCRQMQAVADVPIIIAFRLQSQIDTVLAFELGVAGYISDPSRLHELVARVRAALRVTRTSAPRLTSYSTEERPSTDRFEIDGLTVDFSTRVVIVAGQAVHLPRLEFDLLALLLSPPGRVRARHEIMDRLWTNRSLAGSRTLDTHIRRLRLKIRDNPSSPRYLVTVRGVGFRFDPGSQWASSSAGL